MQTALQELKDKMTAVIKDNEKSNSQFHKGFRYAMGMVIESIELQLLEQERQQIGLAFMDGKTAGDLKIQKNGEDYYNKTYQK